MKKILVVALSLVMALTADAQMTLQHRYAGSSGYYNSSTNGYLPLEVVNLALSGRKYALQSMANSQVLLYNMDFSLWKTINLPAISCDSPIVAYYISENLFKIDGLVDMAVYYANYDDSLSCSGTNFPIQVIINETGAIINEIDSSDMLQIYSAGVSDTFVAISGYAIDINAPLFNRPYNTAVYSLPGTIPCNICGNGLGLGRVANPNGGELYPPVPNPSSQQARIDYNLPNGVSQGTITVFNVTGQKVKTYTVDSHLHYIVIDNTTLPSGVYYYSLSADGMETTSKKMVVVQ